jgi:predicted dehydrogenase
MLASADGSYRALDESPLPRIGVVGYGYWGPNLVRNLRDSRKAELAGIAEVRRERHDEIKMFAPGVEVVDDHRRLIESDVDALVIATPIHTHFALAYEALQADKHVLIEKPMAASVEEASELVRLASALSRTLMVGHTFVYNPAVEELARLVGVGELGRIYHVDTARLNLGLFQQRSDVIWDLAPHDISILMHVLGQPPILVSARGSTCIQSEVHDVAYLELIYEDGLSAQVHVSWLDPTKVRRVTVVGDRKMAVFNDVAPQEKLRIYDIGVDFAPGAAWPSYRFGPVTIPPVAWREPLLIEVEHFAECIRYRERPLSDGLQGMMVVATLEAASRSLAAGGERIPVTLPLLADGLMKAGVDGPTRAASPVMYSPTD